MSWTANSYFVTVAILFLWRVQEIAEACSCSPAHPQQAFCNSDVGKCQRWVPQKGSIFLLVPLVSVAVIPGKKKKWKRREGKKLPHSLCLQLQGGGVGGGGAEGGIFCLSQPFSPLPSSAPSLFISSYCFPVWQMFWSSFSVETFEMIFHKQGADILKTVSCFVPSCYF